MKKHLIFFKSRYLNIFTDLLVIPIAWYLSYWLRFNITIIPHDEFLHASYLLVFLTSIQFVSFWVFGLYRSIWDFASLSDLFRIIKAVLVGVMIYVIFLFFIGWQIPRAVIPIYTWLLISLLGGTRISYRWLKHYCNNGNKNGKRTLIVGAGQAADLLIRELAKNTKNSLYKIIAMVDDDKAKVGCELHGIRIIGNLDELSDVIDKYEIDLVVIAIPSIKSDVMHKIINYCQKSNVEFRIVPKLNDLTSGNASINALREVLVEDLLGRKAVNLDWHGIEKAIKNKIVLVSGGGGSIGSELCMQIAKWIPGLLIIIDNCEFNLYKIDQKLRNQFPGLSLIACLVDVTDLIAVKIVMNKYKPEIVFHAAAYKHVPLLEEQARAAIRNNVLGTFNIASVSCDNNVNNFVLISTDKAVNPTNIMGATKRAAEIICQNFNGRSNTQFITVRFGNVLNSAGSVIPLFKEQLLNGIALTVTHPEVTRYFMTIPEATQLILQALVLGENGEIFVLDMGEPIKIKELAEQMIYLSGKKLGENANIVYTGLRPGEKLYEELFYDSEELSSTKHIKIKQAQYQRLDWEFIYTNIINLKIACDSENDCTDLIKILFKMVPEYKKN